MDHKIGILLPRSTDYPSLGVDILHGFKAFLKSINVDGFSFFTENIGFGEKVSENFSKAEKLFIENDIDLLLVYCNQENAESIYPLARAMNKTILFLDAGMKYGPTKVPEGCHHISLDGSYCCYHSGRAAGEDGRKVLMASSFYDAGYAGPAAMNQGIIEAGGSINGQFVSPFKLKEFTIEAYLKLLHSAGVDCIGANFSVYLFELFFRSLKEHAPASVSLPFYCSPFMGEEIMLAGLPFPGGEFQVTIPWSRKLKNEEQASFKTEIKANEASIFHLLGWEAAICSIEALVEKRSLNVFSFTSPRGQRNFHPETGFSYGEVYTAKIQADEKGFGELTGFNTVPQSAEQHLEFFTNMVNTQISGWTNNFFCI